MPREIRADQAALYISTKRDLWAAMQLSGWYLPRLGPAVTVAYMEAVRDGQVWCPTYEQVKLRPCLKPPPVKQLLAWIEEALHLQQAYNPRRPLQLGFVPSRPPDAQWALFALSTIQPNHRVFGKGYVREPPPLDAAAQALFLPAPMVNNADGLFDGLPLRTGKPARRTVISKVRPSVSARLEVLRQKTARLQAQMAALAPGA